MRIAVFTPYYPYPPDTGGKIRSYHLLRALAARFEVDVFVPYHGAPPDAAALSGLQAFCHDILLTPLQKSWRTRDRLARVLAPLPRSVDHFYTPESLAGAQQRLQTGAYQVVIADEICMTPYAELAPTLPRLVLRQKVDSLHYYQVAAQRPWNLDKLLDYLEGFKLGRYERAKMPLYQAFLACSADDARLIQPLAPQARSLVVANGADLSYFRPTPHPADGPPILLYVGSMHYYPNIDAVTYFCANIYEPIRQQYPTVQLQIVGHLPPPEVQQLGQRPGILVTGSVPDVRPYYAQATVFCVPLRLGGGTRLKIIEAMAMGLPVVSTTVGAEGLDICPGENILIADDPVTFAQQTQRLLADPALRAHLAHGGQQLAQRYDWLALAQPFVDLMARLTQETNTIKSR